MTVINNKFSLLDKGWVAPVSSNLPYNKIRDLCTELFSNNFPPALLDVSSYSFVLRCPLFVQMNLSKFNITVVGVSSTDELDAYIPSLDDIGSDTIANRKEIQEYFAQTVEALIINSQSMPKDGTDKFISQTIMPISMYTRIFVSASLRSWVAFLKQSGLPTPIEVYRKQIYECIKAEWPNMTKVMEMA